MASSRGFARYFASIALSAMLVLGTVVPVISLASPFSTDTSVVVYPNNDTLDFGTIRENESSTKTFIVENFDTVTKSISVITYPDAPFTYNGSSIINIPAYQEAPLSITFDPNAEGSFDSYMRIRVNSTGEMKSLYVEGNASDEHTDLGLSVSHSNLVFPGTLVGEYAEATVSLTNHNSHRVDVDVTELPNEPFELISSGHLSLDAGATKYVIVRFSPESLDHFSSSLEITSDEGSFDVDLSGEGVASSVPLVAEVGFSQVSRVIDFGLTNTDIEVLKQVTITNLGGADLELDVTTAPDEPFEVSFGGNSSDSITVAEDKSTQLKIAFKPEYPGFFQDSFTISTNAANAPAVTYTVVGSTMPGSQPAKEFTGNVQLDDGEIRDNDGVVVNYRTSTDATVDIVVKKDGQIIKTLRSVYDGLVEGNTYHDVSWFAKDGFGYTVPDGVYTIKMTAFSTIDGQATEVIKTVEVDLEHDTIVYPVPADPTGILSVSSDYINTDIGESAFFNYYLEHDSDVTLAITDTRTGFNVVTTKFNNVYAGAHNWDLSWDGRGRTGLKVSAGEYHWEFKIAPTHPSVDEEIQEYDGYVMVVRSASHMSAPIRTSVGSYQEPVVPRNFNFNTPQNDSLITKLRVEPAYLTQIGQPAFISFETLHFSNVTARITDAQGNVVRNLTKGRPVQDGYHLDNLIWYGDDLNGNPVADGRYRLDIETDYNMEYDNDVAYINVATGGARPYMAPNPSVWVASNQPVSGYPTVGYVDSCTGFADVYPVSPGFCDAVNFSVNAGIFEGSVEDGYRFLRPDDYLTRAEATAVVLRIMEIAPVPYNAGIDGNLGFSDLDTNSWYMPYIKTIIKTAIQQQAQFGQWVRNIMEGYPDGTIRPNQTMSRAEFYKVFLEAAVNSNNVDANFTLDYSVDESPFSDTGVNESTAWYMPYADWAAESLNGTPYAATYFDSLELSEGVRRFKPTKGITRAEVVDLIFTTHSLGLINY